MLEVKNLSVKIKDKEILNNLSIEIKDKEIVVLMGPNGSGKSTLSQVIMGNPTYGVTSGDILFNGTSILGLKPDERSRAGIFLSFQNPVEIDGITVNTFLKSIVESRGKIDYRQLRKDIGDAFEFMGLDKDFGKRYLNYRFSGGEKKKLEMVQMLLLKPKFAILDETDSGLDIDALKLVNKAIKKLDNTSYMVITHHMGILDNIDFDKLYVMSNGRIVKEGKRKLLEDIRKNGFLATP